MITELITKSLTPRQFAQTCKLACDIREDSYVVNNGYGKYMKDWDEASRQACLELRIDPVWAEIISVLCFPGYSDVWDWCDKQ